MRSTISKPFLSTVAAALAVVAPLLGAGAARAESVLRVAMTSGDIPEWTGSPDQGYEGYRFVGFSLYDAMVEWDLSRSDVYADIRPGLAESWEVDPKDPKRWIFHLRHGVKFHDGCDWNADSAVWNFKRVMDSTSPQYNPRHHAGQSWTVTNVAAIDKINDDTISITTSSVDSLMPYEIAVYYQISNCAVTKLGNDYDAFAKAPSGTGPYKFDKVVPHERLELLNNASYWDTKRIPKHDRLVLLPMPEAATRAAALLSGQVDFIEAPSPDTVPKLKSAGMQIVTAPYPHNWNYQLRFDRPPFNDLRVRQAANYAMNRDEMVEMLQGFATPGYGTFIESQPYYGKPVKYEYDPDKAKALLKAAGCLPCSFSVAISTSGSGQMQPLPMNELVKEQLEAVGFKVKIVSMDWNALLDVFFNGPDKYPQYDAVNVSLSSIEPEQGLLKEAMTRYSSPNGENWGKFSNPVVDKLGDEATATFDVAKRNAILGEMHEKVIAEAFDLFIVHDLNPRALSPKLKGFVQAQSWFQDLTPIVVQP